MMLLCGLPQESTLRVSNVLIYNSISAQTPAVSICVTLWAFRIYHPEGKSGQSGETEAAVVQFLLFNPSFFSPLALSNASFHTPLPLSSALRVRVIN